MRIVSREAFLAMPAGTLYAKWGKPGRRDTLYAGELTIKGGTYTNAGGEAIDWVYDNLIPWPVDCEDSGQLFDRYAAMQDDGAESGPLDFDGGSRDGLFDADQLFLVFSADDTAGLIDRLQRALADQKANS